MSILQAYLINGSKVVVELTPYKIEDLEGNSPIIIASDTVQEGYADISSIENWYAYGETAGKDWKFVRKEIKTLLFSIAGNDLSNYANLNDNEKKIVAELFLVPKSLRTSFFNETEDFVNSIKYNTNSIKSRSDRYTSMLSVLYLNLLATDIPNILLDITSAALKDNYIYYGIDGIRFNTSVGIFDYIESTIGTIYESNGLASRISNLTSTEIQDLIVSILEILEFGNYDKSLNN